MADDAGQETAFDDFDAPLDEPEVGPGGETSGDGIPQQETGDAAGNLPPDLVDAYRREGLRLQPDESTTDAYSRLTNHLTRKSAAFYRDQKEAEVARANEMRELRVGLEPMLRDYHQRQREAQLEEQAAQIPDKETDPQGYAIWLQEETLRRDEARRNEEWQRVQEARRQQAESEFAGQVAQVDNAGYAKVAEGLGLVSGRQPDPEFTHAYEVYSESALEAARSYFPDANEHQIHEFIGLSQQLDIRRAEMNGVDIRDVMKGRMNKFVDSLVRRGVVARVAGVGSGNGNGGTSTGDGRATGRPDPTVAQRVSAASSAAQRRGPSAVASNTRPAGLGGQLPDAAGMDEDDFVEAALSGLLGTEEQRASQHRKAR